MEDIHRLNFTQLKMMTKKAGIDKPGRSKDKIIDYVHSMDPTLRTEFMCHVKNVLMRQDQMSQEKVTFEHDCGHSDAFDADMVDAVEEDVDEADEEVVVDDLEVDDLEVKATDDGNSIKVTRMTLNRNQVLAYLSLNGQSLQGNSADLVSRVVNHAFLEPEP
jgi:hypothetical protein